MVSEVGWRFRALAFGLVAVLAGCGGEQAGVAHGNGNLLPPASPQDWALPNPALFDVYARGERVWAVGYWGSVLRSTDAGETWTRGQTPTAKTLYGIAFGPSGQQGWAVGEHGTLLRSEDGGMTWTPQTTEIVDSFGDPRPLDGTLFDVAAISDTEAWAVGDFGMLLYTRDGETWGQIPVSDEFFADDDLPERILNAVQFPDPQNGWVIGEFGTTLRTTDGGETWSGERTLEGVIADIYLFDAGAGIEGGAIAGGVGGVVIRTLDGGASWTTLNAPTTAGLFGAAWQNGAALVVGDRGVLLASFDRGETWVDPKRPRLFNWLRSATFAGNGHAYAVGEAGLVLRSLDGGRTWKQVSGREPAPQSGISVPDPHRSTDPGRRDSMPRQDPRAQSP